MQLKYACDTTQMAVSQILSKPTANRRVEMKNVLFGVHSQCTLRRQDIVARRGDIDLRKCLKKPIFIGSRREGEKGHQVYCLVLHRQLIELGRCDGIAASWLLYHSF